MLCLIVDVAAVAAATATATNKAFCTAYNPVPTTRQLTVPPITPKVQTTNAASAYAASQFLSQSAAAGYNYSNMTSAQTVSKVFLLSELCLRDKIIA